MNDSAQAKPGLAMLLCGAIGAVCVILLIAVWNLLPSRDLYLSDIEDWEVITFEWKEPIRDASIDGNNILIGELYYPKGIGMHAITEVDMDIPGGYERFVSDVGVDDEITDENPASVIFEVYGDGVLLARSPLLTAKMPPYRLAADIEGIRHIKLIATDGGDGHNSDHADWGNARLVKD